MGRIQVPTVRSVTPNSVGVWVLCAIALLGATLVKAPAPAGAVEGFTPCPSGQVKADQGYAQLTLSPKMRKRLATRGVGVTLLKPAEFTGGQPTYPVRDAQDRTNRFDARLAGGFRIRGDRKRPIRARLTRLIHDGQSRKVIKGQVNWGRGWRKIDLFRVRGETVVRNQDAERFTLKDGRARLSPALARTLRRKAGFRAARAGQLWANLFLTRIAPFVPDAKPPPEADPFPEPEGADAVTGGSLVWEVRKSWVDYLGTGRTTAVGGASPVSASKYRFTFPFEQGWVKRGDGGTIESASLEASGGVYFRACGNQRDYLGINFQTVDPEFQFDGDSARLVFNVQGIDQTPFPGSRAVVVDLTPGEPSEESGRMEWTAMSGKVAPGAYGLFSGQYRPGTIYGDSFGSADVTIEWGGEG